MGYGRLLSFKIMEDFFQAVAALCVLDEDCPVGCTHATTFGLPNDAGLESNNQVVELNGNKTVENHKTV
jgi:hypothetical protein